jgi:hypothetical protein
MATLGLIGLIMGGATNRSKMPQDALGGVNTRAHGVQRATYKPQTTAEGFKNQPGGGTEA